MAGQLTLFAIEGEASSGAGQGQRHTVICDRTVLPTTHQLSDVDQEKVVAFR
jgi:hypothetical protein